MYLPSRLQTFFFLPCLGPLLALLLFRQLSFVKAGQKFPRLRCHAPDNVMKSVPYVHTPPRILIEDDSFGLSEFCSLLCFNDLVRLCQEVNI
jgi:hypothetical protein